MATLVGADPELFLRDQQGNLRASCGLFGGTKDKPLPFGSKGFALQEDNVALEFNIPPAYNAEMFDKHFEIALAELRQRSGKLGLSLAFEASAVFPSEELKSPGARVFGCDPDWNAWFRDWNPMPRSKEKALRSCGGHVHVGCRNFNEEQRVQTVRWMDVLLGVPSLFIDKDSRRRELYGNAGALRMKPYGVEYRTLSNFWVADSSLRKWVFDETQKAVEFVKAGTFVDDNKYMPVILSAINKGNLDDAKRITEEFKCVNIPSKM